MRHELSRRDSRHLSTRTSIESKHPYRLDAFVLHGDAVIRGMSREELDELQKYVAVTQGGIFRGLRFHTNDSKVHVNHVAPQIGGSGWARWPYGDHYLVSKDGKEVFRSQNLRAVYAYVAAYVRENKEACAPTPDHLAKLKAGIAEREKNRREYAKHGPLFRGIGERATQRAIERHERRHAERVMVEVGTNLGAQQQSIGERL